MLFDSLTFRMRKENSQDENDGGEGEGEVVVNDVDSGVAVADGGYGVGDNGGGDNGDNTNDDEEGEEGEEGEREERPWSDALRLMLSHGYSIHGDHYDPSLVPTLFGEVGLWLSQDQDQGSGRHVNLHQKTSAFQVKDKDRDKDKEKGVMRMYSCQQSLMKMHPLLDQAIVKVVDVMFLLLV